MEALNQLCPACGYNIYKNLGVLPWKDDSPSDEICPSCSIQFGYQDLEWDKKKRSIIYARWRNKWIKEGMIWDKGRSKPPMGWNPKKQLENITKINKKNQ